MRVWGLIERTQTMKGKRHTTEEKIRILRKAETGTSVQTLCREHQISEQTFYRWKRGIWDAVGQPGQTVQGTGEGKCPAHEDRG